MSDTMSTHFKPIHMLAMQIEGLVTALNSCIDDPDRHSLCVSMIEEAAIIAPKLSSLIDRADTRFGGSPVE